jgi:hypothetical protein
MQIAFATAEDQRIIEEIDGRYFRMHLPQSDDAAVEQGRTLDGEIIVATQAGELAGYADVIAPGGAYPIERHFRREQLPMAFDEGLFEVRIVVVGAEGPAEQPALSLAYAALRSIEHRGGTHVVSIARVDLIPFFRKLGLVPLELRLHSGVVEFEVMHASVPVLRRRSGALATEIEHLRSTLAWQLPFAFDSTAA